MASQSDPTEQLSHHHREVKRGAPETPLRAKRPLAGLCGGAEDAAPGPASAGGGPEELGLEEGART